MILNSFRLSSRGVVRLLDRTYRVIWDGEYCAHDHKDHDAACLCLGDYDRRQRQIDRQTAVMFGMNA